MMNVWEVVTLAMSIIVAHFRADAMDLTYGYFPDNIVEFPVRKDYFSDEPISRGRLHLVGEKIEEFGHRKRNPNRTKVSFVDYRKHLQCSPNEPDLNGRFGNMHIIKMAPPTMHSLRMICAWTEDRRSPDDKCNRPWSRCDELAAKFDRGEFPERLEVGRLFTSHMLFRVINGTLYEDWPWGRERIARWVKERYDLHYELVEMAIRGISDIGDSAFFLGNEQPYAAWNLPFPAFSSSSSLSFGNIPWPWPEEYTSEAEIYRRVQEHNNDFSDGSMLKITGQLSWEHRIPKAAYYSSYVVNRQIAFDQAALRPDLFEAAMTVVSGRNVYPWNPDSYEHYLGFDFSNETPNFEASKDPRKSFASSWNYSSNLTRPGFVEPLFRIASGVGKKYIPGHFKYVIIISNYDESTSGRLAHLIAHSGAVILLQETRFSYHFQARFIPWVHYVPISFSASDLIEKIEWLKANDHLAKRLAENARNFGKSYLRMEDYYCYAATALQAISDIEKQTDITHVQFPGPVLSTHHLQ